MFNTHINSVARNVVKFSSISRKYTYKPLYNFNFRMMQSPIIYPTLQSVLDVFQNDDRYMANENVQQLMQIYVDVKAKARNAVKAHPLIVLEGLDLAGKSTFTRLLSSKINAQCFRTPPACISPELRDAFDDQEDLRTAFYALGNYIAAFQLLELLEKETVVLDRFWHSTATTALAMSAVNSEGGNGLPSREDDVYQWPADLLKPDIVLLLTVSEPVRLLREQRRKKITKGEEFLKTNHIFRQNVLLAYQYMKNPNVVMISSDLPKKDVLENLLSEVAHLINPQQINN